MMRLFLVEKGDDGRKIPLGDFKFNDELRAIAAAKKKHKFIDKMETNSFEFVCEKAQGPLRRGRPETLHTEQKTIFD